MLLENSYARATDHWCILLPLRLSSSWPAHIVVTPSGHALTIPQLIHFVVRVPWPSCAPMVELFSRSVSMSKQCGNSDMNICTIPCLGKWWACEDSSGSPSLTSTGLRRAGFTVGDAESAKSWPPSSFERSFDVSRVCSYLTNAYANICCKNKCKMLQDFWTFATSLCLCFSDFSMLHTCFTNFTSEINFRDSKITFRLLSQTT
jgi:hypothetical protein